MSHRDIEKTGNDPKEEDWEDGTVSGSYRDDGHPDTLETGVSIELNESQSPRQRRTIRRASAEDKVSAELVHKVHLLCLLARGRLVDAACDDPLIQASLLSLLPCGILKPEGDQKLTIDALIPFVNWFRNNFCAESSNIREGDFKANLLLALEAREGTAEEVAALSVALFRALNLSTRFVSILDVASLKPDVDGSWGSNQYSPKLDTKISSPSSLKIVECSDNDSASPTGFVSTNMLSRIGRKSARKGKNEIVDSQLPTAEISNHQKMAKRKGDVEFELQLEMALSATAAGTSDRNFSSNNASICSSSTGMLSYKRSKKSENVVLSESSQPGPGAVWSRKKGPPLYWAEVYCGGTMLMGKWVHVDAANGIIDKEHHVESASAASRRPLKYVVAFAGSGAKDVTRRYCAHWYKIASQRIDASWWAQVLSPLKQLESAATGAESSQMQAANTEDMELEIRGLTEPLPANQLAYKKHHLYALEKFLTKYEALYPKGPVLGYCSGHPVYPRACVQTLQTRQKWLREGLQVKANEPPAKVVKSTKKLGKGQYDKEGTLGEDDEIPMVELFGMWQLEPLRLPPALDGIVPKNEHGNVEVWSEKCLPPGTVHLRLPRLVPVAQKLGINFAPAMVGFEFRNSRSFPVFDGIVICSEFKDAILEAYAEEEERREVEEKKRREAQALSRWYQLLCSLITRQRLNSTYLDPSPAKEVLNEQINREKPRQSSQRRVSLEVDVQDLPQHKDHEHIFPVEDQSYDDESFIRTKRCPCGFSIQVEEL